VAIEPMRQEELLRDSLEQLEQVDQEAQALAGGLSPEELHRPPASGGWSVAQVLAHLAASNGSYVEPLRQALERGKASGAPPAGAMWKPSLFGGLLLRSLDPASTRRTPSPKGWRPTTTRPERALESFLESQRAIEDLVRSAHGVDLVRARLSSPASRLIRLNAGDAIRIFVVHDRRHMGQIRRILKG
jgi:uncharacterized damage-inducible protein DinB